MAAIVAPCIAAPAAMFAADLMPDCPVAARDVATHAPFMLAIAAHFAAMVPDICASFVTVGATALMPIDAPFVTVCAAHLAIARVIAARLMLASAMRAIGALVTFAMMLACAVV